MKYSISNETLSQFFCLFVGGMSLGTLVLRHAPHSPGGRYVVLYEGQGRISFRFSAREISRRPGKLCLNDFINSY